jgi:hypothetical protein
MLGSKIDLRTAAGMQRASNATTDGRATCPPLDQSDSLKSINGARFPRAPLLCRA